VSEAEVASATEVEEIEAAVDEVVDEVHEEEATRKRRSGSQSPSSVVL